MRCSAHTLSLSDSRPEPFPRLLIPSGRWGRFSFPAPPGLPGSSTDLFLRAVPNHPGRSGECLLIASPPISGFLIFGWPPSLSVTRPNRVRLRYGSQVCFPGFHQTDCSASLRFSYTHERAIYMVNSFQFTRSARLSLGLAWYSQAAKAERPTPVRKDFKYSWLALVCLFLLHSALLLSRSLGSD